MAAISWNIAGSSLLLYALLGIGVLGISAAVLGLTLGLLRLCRFSPVRIPPAGVRASFVAVPVTVAAIMFWFEFVSPRPLFESRSPDGRYLLRVGEVLPFWGGTVNTKIVLRLRNQKTGRTVLKVSHVTRDFRTLSGDAPDAILYTFPVDWGAAGSGRGVFYIPQEAVGILLPGGKEVSYRELGPDFDRLIRDYLAGTIDAGGLARRPASAGPDAAPSRNGS